LQAEGRPEELSHLDRLANHLERLERAKAQDELAQLTDKLLTLGPGGTYKRWGYIPSREGHSYTLVTTMFVHGGLMHLVGNMMLFFLLAHLSKTVGDAYCFQPSTWLAV
jgi:membrane associated rhomboid family serine protease